jgi:hypothetical protein
LDFDFLAKELVRNNERIRQEYRGGGGGRSIRERLERQATVYKMGQKYQHEGMYIRGLQFYAFFGISIGITLRMIDIGKK